MRMNERTRRRTRRKKNNNINNSLVLNELNEWSVWLLFSQDPGTNPGTSHCHILSSYCSESSFFLSFFLGFVLFVFYLILSARLFSLCRLCVWIGDPYITSYFFPDPWRMNGPSQSATQTSPLVFCRSFFVSSSSSLLLTEPIILYIVGGKALNERYSLLDEKRERERKTLSLVVRLLSVGPESLNVFFTDRGRRRLLLVVSPFLKKRKPYFFLSARKKNKK